jgi:hypothetical protein
MGFAEQAFAFDIVKSTFEDRLLELADVAGDDWESLGWDEYDASLEIYGCTPNLRLPQVAQDFIFGEGFDKIYVNHTDEWETHYNTPGTETPWRRKRMENGGFEINFVPESWKPVSDDWLKSGYVTVSGTGTGCTVRVVEENEK